MVTYARFFCIAFITLAAYLALPSFRGILKFALIHVIVFGIALLINGLFGLKQVAAASAKKFFAGFRVGGHRGAPKEAPENTIEAFQKALGSKMDLIEFDLALSSDGHVVLMHDDDLLRTCGEPGQVASTTLKELKTKNAGYGFAKFRETGEVCQIPTLEEAVNFCKENDLRMLFDVKDWSSKMVSKITEIIAKNDLYDKVIVSSFFPWVSYAVKKADPKILTGITTRPFFFSYADLANTKPRYSGLKQILFELLDIVNVKLLHSVLPSFLGVEMFLTNQKDIHCTLVEEMRKKKIEVVAWTVNDQRQMLYYGDTLKIPFLTDVPHVYDKLQTLRETIKDSDE